MFINLTALKHDSNDKSQLVRVKPSPLTSWLPMFSKKASTQPRSKGGKLSKLAKLTVSQEPLPTIPDCCRRLVKAAMMSSSSSSSLDERVKHRFVDDATLLYSQFTLVGGRRVPFFATQTSRLRRARPFSTALMSIEEEVTVCESCHSYKFSSQAKTITLTKLVRRNYTPEPVDCGVVAKAQEASI
ncbi:hypothetical protein LEN26_013885 [Aphanomyces euteiches]|nr:hypothetical protein AeMF1_021515 [Aphanomyces euteiches]KAH9110008.1 hypothetical protein LEN26_013885 [Aphanomyces euteiches]KAH9197689.1 hypothetical protein AeNC1_000333 [Aphanomyces euteiches]